MKDILINRNHSKPEKQSCPRLSVFQYSLSNIFLIAKKDMTFVYRQKPLLGLLLLTPTVLALIIASCGPLEVENIPTAIYCADDSFAASIVVDEFRDSDAFDVKNVWSEKKAENMVKDGEVSLAIIIPEGFWENIENNEKTSIKIIVDGSKPDIAAPLMVETSKVLRQSSSKLGTIVLKERLVGVAEVGKDLRSMECTFVGAVDMLNEMRESTEEMSQPLSELSTSALALSSSLEEMKEAPSFTDLNEMGTELENTEREIQSLDDIISDFEEILDLIGPLELTGVFDVDEASASVDATQASMNTLRLRMSSFRETLKEIDATIEEALVNVENMQTGLGAIGSEAESSEETIESADEQMENALIAIDSMNTNIKKISESTGEISSAVEPFTTEESNIYGRDIEPWHFFGIAFIPVILLYVPMLLASLLIATEKETGTIESLITSPIPYRDVMLGKGCSCLLFGILTFLIMVGINLAFGVVSRGSIGLLFLVGISVVLVGVGIGLVIGAGVKSQMAASIAALLTVYCLLLVGGLFWSIELTGWAGHLLAAVTPLTYGINSFRDIMMKGFDAERVVVGVIVLLCWAAATFILSISLLKKMSRRG